MLKNENDLFSEEEDKLRDECGVVGIYLNTKKADEKKSEEKHEYVAYSSSDFSAATQAYYALYALQHRGQDSAGIAVSDGTEIKMHKAMGTTAEVFNKESLLALTGHIAVGHEIGRASCRERV